MDNNWHLRCIEQEKTGTTVTSFAFSFSKNSTRKIALNFFLGKKVLPLKKNGKIWRKEHDQRDIGFNSKD